MPQNIRGGASSAPTGIFALVLVVLTSLRLVGQEPAPRVPAETFLDRAVQQAMAEYLDLLARAGALSFKR